MINYAMVIDTTACIGCGDCVVACKNENKVPAGLNRDWVVEATRKPGVRHVFSKRVLYLDEDSWAAWSGDMYDNRDNLTRIDPIASCSRMSMITPTRPLKIRIVRLAPCCASNCPP